MGNCRMVYEDIYKIFPEIHEIKDKVLQQKSADALISAMKSGDGMESVYLAPRYYELAGMYLQLS